MPDRRIGVLPDNDVLQYRAQISTATANPDFNVSAAPSSKTVYGRSDIWTDRV